MKVIERALSLLVLFMGDTGESFYKEKLKEDAPFKIRKEN